MACIIRSRYGHSLALFREQYIYAVLCSGHVRSKVATPDQLLGLFTFTYSMPVRLRLSLHGLRHNRIFHLVAVDIRKRRDAKPIELLGVYDPRLRLGQESKTMHWSVDRIFYWLEKGGAQPSKSVVKLLERVCVPFFLPS